MEKPDKYLKILLVEKEIVTEQYRFKNIIFQDEQTGMTCQRAIWRNKMAYYENFEVGTPLKLAGEIVEFHGYRMVVFGNETLHSAFKASDLRTRDSLTREQHQFLYHATIEEDSKRKKG